MPDAPAAERHRSRICWPLGLAFDALKPELCAQKRSAWVLDRVLPPTLPDRDAKSWNADVLQVRLDAPSGLRLGAACSAPQVREIEIARWPALAYPWLSREQRQRASLPALAAGCAADGLDALQPLRIDGLADEATIARAPNSAKPASVRLRALGATGEVLWLVNGRLAATTTAAQSFEHAFAETGAHTITAMTDAGAWAQVRVRVLR